MSRTHAVLYRDAAGVEPVDVFIDGLPDKVAAKVDAAIEEHLDGRPADAPPPAFPISSQIEGRLREMRVTFGHDRYRVLYQRSENLVVLLHALQKTTAQLPLADIEIAQKRMADFRRRMNEVPRRPPRPAGADAGARRS